ncbi:Zn-ribbon domain-containing OB-fold protein [Mycolicibacterium sp. ELW1]|uniref:Zn-ribbon domain-containing OB-fold protein n=1 Tax=Mycobacteriaceae TaxID=1762 RepID=UPI00336A164C
MARDRNFHADFASRVDSPYWAGLARGELTIQRCANCGQWIWPAEWRCGECGSYDFDWPTLPMVGEVYTWTRTHYAFVPDMPVPLTHVLVALRWAAGRRVLGLLTGSGDGLRIGAQVEGYVESASARTRDLPVVRWRLVPENQPARVQA